MNTRLKELFESVAKKPQNFTVDARRGCYQDPTVEAQWQEFRTAARLVAQTCVDLCCVGSYKTGDLDYNRGRISCAIAIRNQLLGE